MSLKPAMECSTWCMNGVNATEIGFGRKDGLPLGNKYDYVKVLTAHVAMQQHGHMMRQQKEMTLMPVGCRLVQRQC